MKNTATVADDERAMFHNWYRTEAEAMPNVGVWMAWMARAAIAHAAPVGADVAASVLLKLCDQLDAMKRRLRAIRGEGQRESYYVADDVNCYVEEARAALAGAPAETVKLPLWIDKEKGKDPFMDDVIAWIETNIPATKPVTFAPGTIVRKKSGSQWEGAIVGTYSSSITPEGYAVESSTHRGSVQIYPVSALELVTKGNV